MFSVQQLNGNRINEYIKVLVERFYWMKQKNKSNMWIIDKLNEQALIDRYKDPMFFGGFEETICVGGFILIEKDNRYWLNQMDDSALYFHKFVVSPMFAGKGYSKRMLDWVKEYGRLNGKDNVRLDYQKNRSYLRKMYISNGFIDISEIDVDESNILVLAETRIVRSD
jgi:hypothetical protein